jgi:hypothetical protein
MALQRGAATQSMRGAQMIRILVMDDNLDFRLAFSGLLEMQ